MALTSVEMNSLSVGPECIYVGDAMINRQDLELLMRDTSWLNDNCINFCWELLRIQAAEDNGKNGGEGEKGKNGEKRSEMVLIPPSSAFAMLFLPAEELLDDSPDNLFKKIPACSLALLPVNDNTNADASGGSHWSLLVYYANELLSLDTSPANYNAQSTLQVVEAFKNLMVKSERNESVKEQHDINFRQGRCPTQSNGYDCGAYVATFGKAILHAIEQKREENAKQQNQHQHQNQSDEIDVDVDVGIDIDIDIEKVAMSVTHEQVKQTRKWLRDEAISRFQMRAKELSSASTSSS